MFLTCCSPVSSKVNSSLSRTWSRTTRLTQIPPGSASASKRPIPVNVVLLGNHIAEFDADEELDPLLRRGARIALGHAALDRDRAPNGVDDAGKFRQETVAGVLHDTPTVLLDLQIDGFFEMDLEPRVRPLLVRPMSRE